MKKRNNKRRSKSFLKTPQLIGVASFFILSLTFFGTSLLAQNNRSIGDAYVSGGIGDARVLIPFLADDSASGSICGLVFNGLTKTDKDLNVVGDLAKKWQISKGGRVITFELREGLMWHDGEPLTADDVKFTYDALMDPRNNCPYTASYSDIERIEVLGPHKIRFVYKNAYAPALLKLGMGIIPQHILEGENLRKSAFKRKPVGSGPYIFEKWKTDEYIILRSNPDYFEHRPYVDRYVARVIPDQAVQYLELITGGIDTMGLTPYQYKYRTNTTRFKERFDGYNYLSQGYTYIGYNLEDPLFADRRVREALSHAVDKNQIIEGVLFGLGEVCTGPFLKGSPYYSADAAEYAYDPEKAKELLKEAGWSDTDGDGILDKDGNPFKFKLITNQGNKVREDVATLVQRQWSQLGIEVEIQIIAWASFIDQFVDKKNFQALILGWSLPVDPDCYNVWHSEASKEGGLNFISYNNREVDGLIEEGRREFDVKKRAKIYKRIHEIIADEAPYTFLFFPYATPAVSKRFRGIEPAPAGIGHNFIDWHVTPDERRYIW